MHALLQRLLIPVAFFALFACGPSESELVNAHYHLSTGAEGTPLEHSELELNLDGNAATLIKSDQSTLPLTLAPLDKSKWRNECPTNYSSVKVETFDVTPSPLVVDTMTIQSPQITAGCDPDRPEAILRGTVDGQDRSFVYEFEHTHG